MSTIQLKYKPLSQGQKKIEKYIYSINDFLGKGSFASVFLARLITDDSPAAVKVIEKRIFANQYNLKNITSQIQIMKKMEHQNIVRLLDVYQTNNNMYIVTQFCNEGDLRNYLKKHRKISQSEAISFLKDIMKGFQYMHKKDIIHRDLKPANILIHNGKLKISDFGFARNLQQGESTILQSIVGTPLYMSPQILTQQSYTNKSDIWSVGLIYYEMLHGSTPWPASNEFQLVNAINNKPIHIDPNISQQSKDFIKKCLKKKEDERMSWQQAFLHPLLHENTLTKKKQQKQNISVNYRPSFLQTKDRQKQRSRSVSNNKILQTNRTPIKSKPVIKIGDKTPQRSRSPWKF